LSSKDASGPIQTAPLERAKARLRVYFVLSMLEFLGGRHKGAIGEGLDDPCWIFKNFVSSIAVLETEKS